MEFDRRFEPLLGPPAADALREWAGFLDIELRLNRVFVNGRSSATVLAVFERSPGRPARQVILKHDQVGDGRRVAGGEHARQLRALAAAGDFARHLAGLVHEPIRVGDGSWISIQEVAGGRPAEPVLLTSVLAAQSSVDLSDLTTEPVGVDRDTFVGVCTRVVSGILTRWAVRPDLEFVSMSQFLRRHLADRVASGKALHTLAQDWPGPTIRLPGEAGDLPNPFALVFDPPAALDGPVDAIVGRGHGDLHTENVLVGPDPADFWLIDLSRYTATAPLTQDPTQLVLSIVNRTLGELGPEQRESLLVVLASPDAPDPVGHWNRLPVWLATLLRSVRAAGLAWIAPSRLSEQWRQATVLSTVACALIYAARATTPDLHRAWLIRLAARCAAVYAARVTGVPVES